MIRLLLIIFVLFMVQSPRTYAQFWSKGQNTSNSITSKEDSYQLTVFNTVFDNFKNYPSDKILAYFDNRIHEIVKEIFHLTDQISTTPNDATLYYKRALLSVAADSLQKGILVCTSMKFDGKNYENYAGFYNQSYRVKELFIDEFENLLKQDNCETIETSKKLREAYDLRFQGVMKFFDPLIDIEKAIQLNPNYKDAFLLKADLIYKDHGEDRFFKVMMDKFSDDALSYVQSDTSTWSNNFSYCVRAKEINSKLFDVYKCLYDKASYPDICKFDSDCGVKEEGLQNIIVEKYKIKQLGQIKNLNPKYPGIDEMIKSSTDHYLRDVKDYELSMCETKGRITEQDCKTNIDTCRNKIFQDCQDKLSSDDKLWGRGGCSFVDSSSCGKSDACDENRNKFEKDCKKQVENTKYGLDTPLSSQATLDDFKKKLKNSLPDSGQAKDINQTIAQLAEENKKVVQYTYKDGHILPEQLENMSDMLADIAREYRIPKEQLLDPNLLKLSAYNIDNIKNMDTKLTETLQKEISTLLINSAKVAYKNLPVMGNFVSLNEATSGVDWISKKKLNYGERVYSFVASFASANFLLKNVGRELRIGDFLSDLYDVKENSEDAVKVIERVNEEGAVMQDPAVSYDKPYYWNSSVTLFRLKGEGKFVRVHNVPGFVKTKVMREKDIIGLTAEEIKNKYSLDFIPEYITDVTVPDGTLMEMSVAKSSGRGQGGGIQFELVSDSRASWYSASRKIE